MGPSRGLFLIEIGDGRGFRSATAALALFVGIVETLADEADRDDGDDGETMH